MRFIQRSGRAIVVLACLLAAVGTAPAAGDGVAPANVVLPAIAGSLHQGARLSASAGSWSGDGPLMYAYQWLRCDSAGDSCAEISGATGDHYRATSSDVGATVRVRVTAS